MSHATPNEKFSEFREFGDESISLLDWVQVSQNTEQIHSQRQESEAEQRKMMFGKRNKSDTISKDHQNLQKETESSMKTTMEDDSKEEDWLVVKRSPEDCDDTTEGAIRTLKVEHQEVIQKDPMIVDSKVDYNLVLPDDEVIPRGTASHEIIETMHSLYLRMLASPKLESVDLSGVAASVVDTYYLAKKNLRIIVTVILLISVIHQLPSSGGRSLPSLISEPKRADRSESELLLVQRLQELDIIKSAYANDLNQLILERDHWRSFAVDCDQELMELSHSHDKLEETVQQSKWLAAPRVAFVAQPPAQMPYPSPMYNPHNASEIPCTESTTIARPYAALVVAASTALSPV
jgi:hypothetical protein